MLAPALAIAEATWSVVIQVPSRRWHFMGLHLGSAKSLPVRISYYPRAGFEWTHLDSRPLAALDEQTLNCIKLAQSNLLNDYQRHLNLCTRFKNWMAETQVIRQSPATMTPPVTSTSDREHQAVPIPSAELGEHHMPESPRLLRKATEAIEAKNPEVKQLTDSQRTITPFELKLSEPPAEPTPLSSSTTTISIFRCDKEETTTRLARLRGKRSDRTGQ